MIEKRMIERRTTERRMIKRRMIESRMTGEEQRKRRTAGRTVAGYSFCIVYGLTAEPKSASLSNGACHKRNHTHNTSVHSRYN